MFDIVRLPSMLNLGDPQLTRFYLVLKAIMAGLLDKQNGERNESIYGLKSKGSSGARLSNDGPID